jgi:hypothetical protein
MLGGKSSHGYEYEQAAMAKAVAGGLYEGCRIFINHREGQRDVMHIAGVFRETRHEGGKVKGNAYLLPDDYGLKFFNIAKTMPEAASCSHVAEGRLVQKDGKRVIEEISKVHSVDLVVAGATTRSVFEADATSTAGGETSVPKPQQGEKQYEFVARCLTTVKAANETLTDEQAGAICFASWQARYESNGTENEPRITPAPKPAQKEAINTEGEIRPERNTPMEKDKLSEELNEIDETMESAAKMLSDHPVHAEAIRRNEHEQRIRQYEARESERVQREKLIREMRDDGMLELNGRHENDSEFWARVTEADRRKNPLKHMTEAEQRDINGLLRVE